MRALCELSVSRDDGEPMSLSAQHFIRDAVGNSGLTDSVLQKVPYIASDGTCLVYHFQHPTDWSSFRQAVIDLTRGWKEYQINIRCSEWLWPDQYETEGETK